MQLFLNGFFAAILFVFSLPIYSAINFDKTIRYCVDPNWYPYEAIINGEHVGMSSDYLKLVAERSGLKFELFPTKSWNESLLLLKSGHCQLTPMLNKTGLRSQFLSFSDVYLESPNVLVSLKEQPFLQGFDNIGKRKVALTKGYRVVEYVNTNYPEIEYELADSEKQGLKWLTEKRVDLFVGSMLTVNYYIYENQLNDLKIAGWVDTEDKLRVGVKHENQELIPIINSAIRQITQKEHLAIHRQWNQVRIVETNNYKLVINILVALLIFIAAIYYRHRMKGKFKTALDEKNSELKGVRNKLEKAEQELDFFASHDLLTQVYNRDFFNQKVIESLQNKRSTNVCFVLLDIDHFRYINEKHGFKLGDDILSNLAKILKQCSRERDIIGRWGGDEFILVYQGTSIKAHALCEQLVESINQYQQSLRIDMTCSIGLTQLTDDEEILDCFRRVTQALFQAKAQGGDQICVFD